MIPWPLKNAGIAIKKYLLFLTTVYTVTISKMWDHNRIQTSTLLKHLHLWRDIVEEPLPEAKRVAVYFGLYEGEECFILDCTKDSLDVMVPAVQKWITVDELNHLLKD
jgi:hypothetical protein